MGVIKESSIIIHSKYKKHQGNSILFLKNNFYIGLDLAKNWDVALAQVVIKGKKNIKKFKLCMERLEDKAIQLPWITGKEQELVEYWIRRRLEETAKKGLPKGTLPRSQIRFAMLGYEAELNKKQAEKAGKENDYAKLQFKEQPK